MSPGRSVLLALVAGVLIWFVSGIAGDKALAQCGNCRPPPTCNTCQVAPPTNCCKPVPPPTNNTACCTPNHNVYVPGVNVYVAPSVVVRAGPRILNRAISGNPASQTGPDGLARSRTSEQKTTA